MLHCEYCSSCWLVHALAAGTKYKLIKCIYVSVVPVMCRYTQCSFGNKVQANKKCMCPLHCVLYVALSCLQYWQCHRTAGLCM